MFNASSERREITFYDTPDGVILYHGVPMYENVAKRNDSLKFGDLICRIRINTMQPIQRFADDLELALYSRPQQEVAPVIVIGLACGEVANRPTRTINCRIAAFLTHAAYRTDLVCSTDSKKYGFFIACSSTKSMFRENSSRNPDNSPK